MKRHGSSQTCPKDIKRYHNTNSTLNRAWPYFYPTSAEDPLDKNLASEPVGPVMARWIRTWEKTIPDCPDGNIEGQKHPEEKLLPTRSSEKTKTGWWPVGGLEHEFYFSIYWE